MPGFAGEQTDTALIAEELDAVRAYLELERHLRVARLP